jgi:DNA-binding NtrC family response regulator
MKRLTENARAALAPEALRVLLAYGWPGNVREAVGLAWALVTHWRAGAREIGSGRDVRRQQPGCGELNVPDRARSSSEEGRWDGSFSATPAKRFERECHQLAPPRVWHLMERPRRRARSLRLSAATQYRYLIRHGLRQDEDPYGTDDGRDGTRGGSLASQLFDGCGPMDV